MDCIDYNAIEVYKAKQVCRSIQESGDVKKNNHFKIVREVDSKNGIHLKVYFMVNRNSNFIKDWKRIQGMKKSHSWVSFILTF